MSENFWRVQFLEGISDVDVCQLYRDDSGRAFGQLPDSGLDLIDRARCAALLDQHQIEETRIRIQLTVAKQELFAGETTCSGLVFPTDFRQVATTEIDLTVVAETPAEAEERLNRYGWREPLVDVAPRNRTLFNRDHRLKLRCQQHLPDASYLWTVHRDGPRAVAESTILGGTDPCVLELPPAHLLPHSTYTFTVRAVMPSGLSSFATASVATQPVPFGGAVRVHPQRGFALATRYTAACYYWTVDDPEELPLSFEFAANYGPAPSDVILLGERTR